MGRSQIPMEERVGENEQSENKKKTNKISIRTENKTTAKEEMTYAQVVKMGEVRETYTWKRENGW